MRGTSYIGKVCLLLLALAGSAGAFTPSAELGLPFMSVFTPDEYNGMGQNWGITQAESGLLYLANGEGVFEYDGVQWLNLEGGVSRTARSIAAGPGQAVYVGYHNELGFFRPDSTGRMVFTSLTPQIIDSLREFRDIWTTLVFHDRVYFCGIKHLFRWQINENGPISGTLEQFTAGGEDRFQALTQLDGRILLIDPARGLLQLTQDQFVELPGATGQNLRPVWSILPFTGNRLLLAGYEGMFIYDDRSLTPWDSDISRLCAETGAYNATFIRDGYYALGTDDEGMVLFDSTGAVLQVVNRDVGLPNNQVLTYPYLDNQGGVWVCLDYGLARVELLSPLQQYDHSLGLEGGVITMHRFREHLFIGTSQGVYTPEPSPRPGYPVRFREVGDMVYSWDMKELAGQLLIAGDGDLLAVPDVDQPPRVIADGINPFSIVGDNEFLRAFAGCTAGPVRSLVFRNGAWRDEGELLSLGEDVMWMTRAPDGAVWATYGFDTLSVARIEFDQTRDTVSVRRLTRFDESLGYREINPGVAFQLGNDWLVGAEKMLYRYDASSDSLVPASENPLYPLVVEGGMNLPTPAPDGSLWFEDEDGICNHVTLTSGGGVIRETPLRRTSRTGYNSFFTEDGALWAGLVGLHLVRCDVSRPAPAQQPDQILLRRIMVGEDSTIFRGAVANLSLLDSPLTWAQRTMRFSYALPCFEEVSRNQYQARLVGLSDTWSAWNSDNHQLYTNLSAGEYNFEVRGRDVHGLESEITSVRFMIRPAWYATWWATTLWVLAAIGLSWSFIKLRIYTVENRNRRLDDLVRERTRELEQLRESEREAEIKVSQMETAYKMAATIAHEFNNPLAIIQASSQLMQKDVFDEDKLREFADKIPPQVMRLRDLLQRIMHIEELREIDYAAGMKILDIHSGSPTENNPASSRPEKPRRSRPRDTRSN